MNPMLKKVLAGAVIGLATAIKIDFEAWKSHDDEGGRQPFDWKVALMRWLRGSMIGASGGLGLDVVTD